MMMKRTLYTIALLWGIVGSSTLSAQQQPLTIEAATPGSDHF